MWTSEAPAQSGVNARLTYRIRFADWMVKDVQTGEIFRADHLVEAVIEARLKGDKEARGVKEEPVVEEDDKKKKKKKAVKSVALKLEDSVVAEYESLLAQVSRILGDLANSRLTTTPDLNSAS